MYTDWASLESEIQNDPGNSSVLRHFPDEVGQNVARAVVLSLAKSLNTAINSNNEPSKLKSDKDVQWTMEVLCYGLTLPLSETDPIKDCVHVYCEWMSALTTPKPCVPHPVVEDPNHYTRVMLHHLYNVFVPRPDAGSSATPANKATDKAQAAEHVSRQTIQCHRVLRHVQIIAQESTIMSRETWETMLKFLLAICDVLLGPPTVKDSIGEQLCERVLSVLFELWLMACTKFFPSPPYWKTFRDMSSNWRHHEALITQWHRVNVALTSKVIKFMYGTEYPDLLVSMEDENLIPESMDNDCIAQCWFRYLHILKNPVDLTRPQIISSSPKFQYCALTSTTAVDPKDYTCLKHLPSIFYKAMKGVSVLVDAFLGISQGTQMSYLKEYDGLSAGSSVRSSTSNTVTTPPFQRKGTKAFGIVSSSTVKGSSKASSVTSKHSISSAATTPVPAQTSLFTLGSRPPYAAARPKVNSILHLFGAWLIEASLAGVKVQGSETVALTRSRTASFIESDPSRLQYVLDSLEEDHDSAKNTYEAGRAEAAGALCRIFCSHKTGEDILPVYLTRFYIAMHYGLHVDEETGTGSGHVMSNIIFNSCDILRVDLDGVMILLPQLLTALEQILIDLNIKFKVHDQIPLVELRKASIHLLLSMLCLPLHFKTLTIKYIFGDNGGGPDPPLTFLSLKNRMIELMLRALTNETDAQNTQMLLGGMLLCVQDLAMCEEAEQTTVQEDGMDSLHSPMMTDPTSIVIGPNAPGHTQRASPMVVTDGETRARANTVATSVGLALPEPETRSRSSTNNSDSSYSIADLGLMQPKELKNFDSAPGLFGHAASLVCNRLMASWKTDLTMALPAIEVLSGLAKVKLNNPDQLMCKRTVNWICEFIVYQCSRPAPAHSKDLHSMIVAAFHCLTVWVVEHDYLLKDKECLHCVLEVVELGISGAKSQNRASDLPKLKGDKDMKPVSQRVKEAAEGLLTSIMDHVGSFPPPCGPESVCSLLDEEALLKYCKDGSISEQGSSFRYFVLEGHTVLGLLEQPLGNDQDPLPTVTALIRGPFGRHAWTMQLRHLPRHQKVASQAQLVGPVRPKPMHDVGVHHNVKHRHFPEIVEQIPLVQADKSVPPLESTMQDEKGELEKLQGFINDQVSFEAKVKERVQVETNSNSFPNPQMDCKPPNVCHDFQTARLFLSHFGFLSLEALKEIPNSSVPPSLVMLDTSEPDFLQDLEMLDSMPCRTADTVFVFYVKKGQKMPFEILDNVTSKLNVQTSYIEFLRSLGWPVDVKKHAGWTGHCNTSWKILPTEEGDDFYPGDTGGSLYDGRKQVLYWADVLSEIAFVVPSPDTYHPAGRRASVDGAGVNSTRVPKTHLSGSKMHKLPSASHADRRRKGSLPVVSLTHFDSKRLNSMKPMTIMEDEGVDKFDENVQLDGRIARDNNKTKSMSLDLEKHPDPRSSVGGVKSENSPMTPSDGRSRRIGRGSTTGSISDTKLFVVWLESFEDHENFPSGDFLQSCSTGLESTPVSQNVTVRSMVYIIFIHALENGLFRIRLQGNTGRIGMAIPLIDGMAVSRRTLGSLVKQTALNIFKRKRLESDTYQPPHVKRKFKIKDLVDKYRNKMIEPEFYTALFQDVAK